MWAMRFLVGNCPTKEKNKDVRRKKGKRRRRTKRGKIQKKKNSGLFLFHKYIVLIHFSFNYISPSCDILKFPPYHKSRIYICEATMLKYPSKLKELTHKPKLNFDQVQYFDSLLADDIRVETRGWRTLERWPRIVRSWSRVSTFHYLFYKNFLVILAVYEGSDHCSEITLPAFAGYANFFWKDRFPLCNRPWFFPPFTHSFMLCFRAGCVLF